MLYQGIWFIANLGQSNTAKDLKCEILNILGGQDVQPNICWFLRKSVHQSVIKKIKNKKSDRFGKYGIFNILHREHVQSNGP